MLLGPRAITSACGRGKNLMWFRLQASMPSLWRCRRRRCVKWLTLIKPPKGIPLIISAKGIEQQTAKFMNEVAAEVVPGALTFVLSGPSFASDVVKGLPTAVTLAAPTLAEAGEWAQGPFPSDLPGLRL